MKVLRKTEVTHDKMQLLIKRYATGFGAILVT
jgi:hypothetical protein